MVRAGCVFVAGIHPSRTWTSGSFESVRSNACVHRLDLGLYSHPKEFLGEWSLNPCLLQGKNPLYRKISTEEDRTLDAVDSEPKHYQRAIPAPAPLLNLRCNANNSCLQTCTASLAWWLRRPPRERKILGSNPAWEKIFSGSSHTSDFKIGIPVATLPGAWRYRVSAGTGRPGVSILWLGEMESLDCNFSLSVAARKIVWVDPSLRYTSILLGR